jgi:fatty acid desaturase
MDTIEARRQWLITPRSWASAGHLAVAWSLYIALAVAAVHVPWWARLPIWLVMGWLLLGNGAVVHECTHRHLFRHRATNRWVGAVAGLTIILPFGVYSQYHLAHHRYTVAIEDPEGPPLNFRSRFEYPLLTIGGLAFLARLIAYGAATAVGHAPSWLRSRAQRRAGVFDAILCVAGLAAVVVAGLSDLATLTTVWLVPWLGTIMVLVPLVLVTEHYGAAVGTVVSADNTRTVMSNAAVRWFYWNNNFHTAHHELPTVVHQGLPALERANGADGRGEWFATGYLAFHTQNWRSLPWFGRSRTTV